MKSLSELKIKGKRVLMRVDFNVPIKDGKVVDDTRIRASLPSINYVIENGGKLILMSHLGRPKGKRDEVFSLKPVADWLSQILCKEVRFMPCCIGRENESATKLMKEGEVMLLENTRFHPEEEKNISEYAKELAKLGDVYVNDAFGSSHRAHASVEGVAHCFENKGAGFLMEKELKYLSALLETPIHPFITVLGGAKVSDKVEVIHNLLPRVDKLLLGGGMVFTFLKSKGYGVGNSLVEEDKIELAKEILNKGEDKIVLPVDIIVGDKFDNTATKNEVAAEFIPEGWVGLDIGPKTCEQYANILKTAKTIFWNGPTGVFEFDNFACSTKTFAKLISEQTEKEAITVIGGGDTVAAINKFGYPGKLTHISTGGGASLEFLAGQKLPGVEALK